LSITSQKIIIDEMDENRTENEPQSLSSCQETEPTPSPSQQLEPPEEQWLETLAELELPPDLQLHDRRSPLTDQLPSIRNIDNRVIRLEERRRDNDFNRMLKIRYRFRLLMLCLQISCIFFALYQLIVIPFNWVCITCKQNFDIFSAKNYTIFGEQLDASDVNNFTIAFLVLLVNLIGMTGYIIDIYMDFIDWRRTAIISLYPILMSIMSVVCLAIQLYVLGGSMLIVASVAFGFVYYFVNYIHPNIPRIINHEILG